jgi:transcriptional regulator with XRE-family HTH domain
MYRIKSAKEIGDRIKRRRKEVGITQEKLSEMLDVTYQQIQRYENGTNQLNTEKLQIIASVLGVSVSYFFEDFKERVAEPPAQCVSIEDERFLRYFRRISKSDYKRCILTFLKLAGGKHR